MCKKSIMAIISLLAAYATLVLVLATINYDWNIFTMSLAILVLGLISYVTCPIANPCCIDMKKPKKKKK